MKSGISGQRTCGKENLVKKIVSYLVVRQERGGGGGNYSDGHGVGSNLNFCAYSHTCFLSLLSLRIMLFVRNTAPVSLT